MPLSIVWGSTSPYFTSLTPLDFKFTNRKEESKFAPKRTKKKEGKTMEASRKAYMFIHISPRTFIHSFTRRESIYP